MEEIILKAEKIADIYERCILDDLKTQSDKIYKALQQSLETLCIENEIITSNSVYKEIFPFSIIYRVKKGESLKEKVIRESLFEKIYSDSKEEIKSNIYKKMDDLIGFTILVDTSKKIDIFKSFISGKIGKVTPLKVKKAELGKLFYYNIKATYLDESYGHSIRIPIEIQIKSTITSAFTNIQHKLIYKNRDVSILKNNNDLMLKSVTSSVVAIEEVIDSVEESFIKSDSEVEIYHRQKKVQELIHEKANNEKIFDVFISDIDNIVKRALEGEILLNKFSSNDQKEIVLDRFWVSFAKENKNSTIQIDTNSFVLKILDSITNINEDLIKKIVCYDYYLKLGKEGTFEADEVHLQKINQIMQILELLYKNNISLYEKLLLDTKHENTDFILVILSTISEFLEEETDYPEIDIEKIIEQAILFSFGIQDALETQEADSLNQGKLKLIDLLETNRKEVFSDEKIS